MNHPAASCEVSVALTGLRTNQVGNDAVADTPFPGF